MVRKVFLLGRPGSGKSTIARIVEMFAKDNDWVTHHIYDYEHLQKMFLQEEAKGISPQERQFRPKGPKECQGFDVVDFSVLDTVLVVMASEAREKQKEGQASLHNRDELILLEFARDDYSHALQQFGSDLLQDAYILYLKVDLEACIGRIHKRIDCGYDEFDHFVSDDIMRSYYGSDDWLDGRLHEYLNLLRNSGIHVDAREIDNSGSLDQLTDKVKGIVNTWLIPQLARI